jgi:hypothetical protein
LDVTVADVESALEVAPGRRPAAAASKAIAAAPGKAEEDWDTDDELDGDLSLGARG